MTVITLTTDFGTSSPTASLLSGVIWRMAPDAHIVDLTHDIPPQDILSAQIVLENTTLYFPDGTIHLATVSPVAGEDSCPIAARLGSMFFVGPDNGLITPLLERAEANRWPVEIYHTNRQEYWMQAKASGPTWQIYASIAGHLVGGLPLEETGERINNPLRVSIPAPEMLTNGWRGQVIQIDHFGNLAMNIRQMHLEGMGPIQILVGGQVIESLSRTFGDGQPGDLIAIVDSSNRLSICVVNGSAAERLNAHTGDPVEIRPK